MKLKARLVIAVLPVALLFALANYLLLSRHQEDALLREEDRRARALASSLATNCTFAIETFQPHLVQTSLNAQFLQRDIRTLEVIGASGEVLAHHDPSRTGTSLRDPLVARVLESGAGSRRIVTTPAGERILEVLVPVSLRGLTVGAVRLGLSLEAMEGALFRSQWQLLALSALTVGLVLGLVIALADRLTRPVVELSEVAGRLAAGDLAARASLGSMHELRVLASSFNQMAHRLARGLQKEKLAHGRLQDGVGELLRFQVAVSLGRLERRVELKGNDELAQLARGLNRMADELVERERSEQRSRLRLEESNCALERANKRLQAVDRQKTDFLASVSHQLRTPLTAVKAFAEIMLECPPEDPETRREFVDIIYRESDRLTRIINNLLDISRIESGRMKWNRSQVSLGELVAQAVEQHRPAYQAAGVELRLDGHAGRCLIDPERIRQCVDIFLENALEHSAHGTTVRARLRDRAGTVDLSVFDQGPGIPGPHLDRIFEKFQSVHVMEGEGVKGTALSLSLCKAVIEGHGGDVEASNRATGGARFTMRLPRSASAEAPSRSQRILVIGGEMLRQILGTALESEGHRVELSAGDEALERARSFRPEVILLDVSSGLELLERLDAEAGLASTRIVTLPVIGTERRELRPAAQGIHPKPLDLERLAGDVERLSNRRGSGTVLVVDDDASVRRSLRDALGSRGSRVLTAPDGPRALELCRSERIDLVVLDIYMPGMSGFEVLKHLRVRPETASVPVLILTASHGACDRLQALSLGAAEVLTKPWSEERLVEVVRAMVLERELAS
ncbi:MAG: response regulator [Armatimonadetes bacterium]|nr:response regulator [Armatimonadota bacterium]